MFEEPTEVDLKVIGLQLGRSARGAIKIANRCDFGYPSVIVTYPELEEGELFPTIFWLTCPGLVQEVSRLESSGLVRQLQKKVEQDPELNLKLERAHKAYSDLRYKLAEQAGTKTNDTLSNVGIAGIKLKKGLKCLHAHLANYLANKQNPVGEIIQGMIEREKVFEYCKKCRASSD